MNSKKKMINLGLSLFLILLFNVSFAQTFKYSTGGNFNISLPSLTTLNPNQTAPPLYYTLFIETGNGRYKKINDPIYSAPLTQPYVLPYNFLIGTNSTALLNIIGHYDTIRPPKLHLVYNPYNSTGDAPTNPPYLGSAKIGLDYSHPTIVTNDTMTTVIVYKPDLLAKNGAPVNGNYIVAFFYNDPANGGNIFEAITDPAKTYPFAFADEATETVQNTKVIRRHDDEVIYAPQNGLPNTIPLIGVGSDQVASRIYGSIINAKGSYHNALYFTVKSGASIDEKNIFLSLAPSTPPVGSITTFKAFIIKYNSTGVINQAEDIDTLQVDQFSRDPNRITTFPNCLNVLRDGPTNKKIKYDIDFQNDGPGKAKHAELTVFVPDGIVFPSTGLLQVTSTVKRINTVFKKKGDIVTRTNNTYEFVPAQNGNPQKIIFTMPDIKLPGVSDSPHDTTYRHGKISFILSTSNGLIPDCMYSDLRIVFTSEIRGMERRNEPYFAHSLIRKNCAPLVPNPNPCPRTPSLPPNGN